MDRKKLFSSFFISLLSIAVFALSTMPRDNTNYPQVQAESPTYSIEFSAYVNRLAVGAPKTGGYSGTAAAVTELGNQVSFNYSGLTNPISIWQTINTNGYITNNAPINGMTSIIINKFSLTASIGIYWSSTQTFGANPNKIYDGSSAQTVICNFNNSSPNYILIKALNTSEINNIVIFYSCQNNYRTLTVGDNADYIGYVTGGGYYLIGQSVTITATAYSGNTFEGWYDGETLISTANPYTFAMPDNDTSYKALFTRDFYTLTLLSNDEIKGTVSGGGSYAYGSNNTVLATPNDGYQFIGWYQGETLKAATASYRFSMPNSDLTLTAHFVTQYDVTLINLNETLGTVIGGGAYGATTEATINATPNEGQYFKAWYDENMDLISRNASHSFSMPANDVTIYAEFSSTIPLEKGDIYAYGYYPQTKVTDSALIETLTNEAGTLPSPTNAYSWIDYGYYAEDIVSSYMWYTHQLYLGDLYRGVYFTSYRPVKTSDQAIATFSNVDYNGYYTGTVYWFKNEPIEWRVLDVVDGKALLMSEYVLDSQDYYHSLESRATEEGIIYANNYAYSDIRTWLTGSFYYDCFNMVDQSRIVITEVDNSEASTAYSSNQYATYNTYHKVFLLSREDFTNTAYGFADNYTDDTARQRPASDYAKSQGLSQFSSFGTWWLRSPWTGGPYYGRYTTSTGSDAFHEVYMTDGGIVPLIWFTL